MRTKNTEPFNEKYIRTGSIVTHGTGLNPGKITRKDVNAEVIKKTKDPIEEETVVSCKEADKYIIEGDSCREA